MKGMILPSPAPAFAWRSTAAGPALLCTPLERCATHMFTTRSWALGSSSNAVDDEPSWREVAAAVGVSADALVRLRQVHGTRVIDARAGAPLQEGDILVSDNPSLALAIQVADCVPLLLADPRTGAAGVAHAGWRGLAARVPQVAVEALARRFGSRPQDLIVAAGPSIGACCYEVGEDVRTAFVDAGFPAASLASWFHHAPCPTSSNPSMPGVSAAGRPGHWFFDGWASVVEQLQVAGVRPGQTFAAHACTASHAAVFCSYRRDLTRARRLAGVIRPGSPRP